MAQPSALTSQLVYEKGVDDVNEVDREASGYQEHSQVP